MEELVGNEKRTQEHTLTHVKQASVGQENVVPVITLSVGWLLLCLLAPSAHNTTRPGHTDTHTAHTPLLPAI